jgi:hypothetical protein
MVEYIIVGIIVWFALSLALGITLGRIFKWCDTDNESLTGRASSVGESDYRSATMPRGITGPRVGHEAQANVPLAVVTKTRPRSEY